MSNKISKDRLISIIEEEFINYLKPHPKNINYTSLTFRIYSYDVTAKDELIEYIFKSRMPAIDALIGFNENMKFAYETNNHECFKRGYLFSKNIIEVCIAAGFIQ